MHYYLSPWIWDAREEGWRTPWPGNTAGLIDLRTVVQIDNHSTPEGFGLFALRQKVVTPALYLGGNLSGTIDKTALKQELGLGENIVMNDLGGVVWELLAMHADPLGATRWCPLMPGASGVMRLYLGGKVAERRIGLASIEWPNIQQVVFRTYRKTRLAVEAGLLPADHHRKLLLVWKRKFRTDDHEAFIPRDLPSETPVRPSTTVTDTFTRANENLEADAAWILLQNAGTPSLVVNSNQCREDTTSPSSSSGQHQTALSSDDHYAQITIEALTAPASTRNYGGPVARCSSNGGKLNGYEYEVTIDSGGTKRGRVQKFTGTSPNSTVLIDEVETINLTDTIYCEADGSSITGKINGITTAGPITDTALSGDLNVGLSSRITNGSVGDIELDNFKGEDLVAAFISYPNPRYAMAGGMQSLAGGV